MVRSAALAAGLLLVSVGDRNPLQLLLLGRRHLDLPHKQQVLLRCGLELDLQEDPLPLLALVVVEGAQREQRLEDVLLSHLDLRHAVPELEVALVDLQGLFGDEVPGFRPVARDRLVVACWVLQHLEVCEDVKLV